MTYKQPIGGLATVNSHFLSCTPNPGQMKQDVAIFAGIGENDHVISPALAVRQFERLANKGFTWELVVAKGIGHEWPTASGRKQRQFLGRFCAFLKRVWAL